MLPEKSLLRDLFRFFLPILHFVGSEVFVFFGRCEGIYMLFIGNQLISNGNQFVFIVRNKLQTRFVELFQVFC